MTCDVAIAKPHQPSRSLVLQMPRTDKPGRVRMPADDKPGGLTRCRATCATAFTPWRSTEVRATFELVRPQPAEHSDRHYEVWFRGVHSNIGGGYLDRGLSDIALAWMMEMYLYTLDKESQDGQDIAVPEGFTRALARLEPQPSADEPTPCGTTLETLEPNPDGELGRPADIRRQGWRPVPAGALIHHSVYRRTKDLLLDHYSSNRRLLRQVPGDARPVYDPPFFYGHTPTQEAKNVATEAFLHIPVRAARWLAVGGECVVRGDDWLALGQRRQDLTHAKTKQTFVDVATAWLLSDRCPASELTLPATFQNYDGADVSGRDAALWVIAVLEALEPYVPSLRGWAVARGTRGGDQEGARGRSVASGDGTSRE